LEGLGILDGVETGAFAATTEGEFEVCGKLAGGETEGWICEDFIR